MNHHEDQNETAPQMGPPDLPHSEPEVPESHDSAEEEKRSFESFSEAMRNAKDDATNKAKEAAP